jgi:hypothetical protein
MTVPELARTGANGHRVYVGAGREYPSVTAIILGGIPKPALPRWAATTTAEFAIANLERLALLPTKRAVDEVKRAPWQARDASADLGTAVHAAIEARVHGQPCPALSPELEAGAQAYLDGFSQFVTARRPRFVTSEATVFSRRHGYAGTLDAVCVLDGTLTLLDVKTGKSVYPEVALQLAAYAHADFIGHPEGTERRLPPVAAGAALHLRPGGYELVPVPLGEQVLAAFLAALEVFRWASEQAPNVLPKRRWR